jgi:hypothetical protein
MNASSTHSATPLLPPPPANAPVRTGRAATGRTFVVGALAGALIGIVGVLVGKALAGDWIAARLALAPAGMGIRWTIALFAMFGAVLVHELGHIVGGVSQGFRFMLLVVGPFKLARKDEQAPIRLSINTSLELAGGIAACIPQGEHALVQRTKWLVLGGPLASVLLALGCALLLAATTPAAWSALVLMTGAVSAALAVVTLIPMRNGNFVTDGKRFLQLHREGPEARRDAAQLSITVRLQSGKRVDDMPREQIAALLEPSDGSIMEFLGRTTAYTWLLSHGRHAEARAQLDRAVALGHGLPLNLSTFIAAEDAFALAWFDRNGAAARARLAPHEKTMRALLPAHDQARLDAALLVAEGETSEARSKIAAALESIRAQSAPSGSVQWTKDRLQEMQAVLATA